MNSQRKQHLSSIQIQTPQLGEPEVDETPLKLNSIDPELPMGFKQQVAAVKVQSRLRTYLTLKKINQT